MDVNEFNSRAMGHRIRTKREAMGFKQEEIALLLGVGRSTYNTIESGKRPLKDDEIVKIAAILQTSCDYILTGTETANLDICEVLNLSNQAVSVLKDWRGKPSVWKDSEDNTYYGQDTSVDIAMLEELITSQEGNNLLHCLYNFIVSDFTKVYSWDESKDEMRENSMGTFIRLWHPEGHVYNPLTAEYIEKAALEQTDKAIRKLREVWRVKHEQASER